MLNCCAFVGRLTADPVIKKTNDGKSVIDFTIAVERDFKSGGKKETDFIRCQAWRSTADFLGRYARKGCLLSISGKLRVSSYKDKYGASKQSFEIVTDSAYICKRPDNDAGGFQASPQVPDFPDFPEPEIPTFEDDIPEF